MKQGLTLVLSLCVAAALGYWVLADDRPSRSTTGELTVHCAAGIKVPVLAVAKEYEQAFGTPVRLVFGGSGTLLSGLRVRAHGDIYLAGDESYVTQARGAGLVEEILPIATMRPVLAVAAGNPTGITGLADLPQKGRRYGLGNPGAAAVGKIVQKVATELGLWPELEAKATVFKPTVNELANDLKLGALDAAVIWDATANQHGLPFVTDPHLQAQSRQVTLGILRCSPDATRALHFARFLTARDRGLVTFRGSGFAPVEGDPWVDRPTLQLMSGAMLRPAIEATLTAFEKREGVQIERIYNGCGILVAQMRTGAIPDAYFACDQTFLDAVQDRFERGATVSANDIVLVVAKGNPHGLTGLVDLRGTTLRVGIGHATKSALGALTKELLSREKIAFTPAVTSPTGDMLVNQLRAGALDAILVYRSNAAHVLEHCAVLDLGADARATQPYAVARDTDHRQLLHRLQRTLRGARSKQRFQAVGFHWQDGENPR